MTQTAPPVTPVAAKTSPERARAGAVLFAVFCLIYAYFFHGGSWNQNSRFDAIRAIVETRSLEVTKFRGNTGDIATTDGKHFYSNKPPAFALLGAPVYAALYLSERAAGIDTDSPSVANANAHVLSFFLSGLPAAAMVWVIFLYASGIGKSTSRAALIASCFGLGTLVFPYAGVLFVHNLEAAGVFAAWFVLQSVKSRKTAWIAGLLVGTAAACDYLVAPIVLLFAVWVFQTWKRRGLLEFLIAPTAWVAVILACNYASFGQLFVTNNTFQRSEFVDPKLFMGVFDWPRPERVWWLTFHPFRGLFYSCPMIILGLISLVFFRPIKRLDPQRLIPPAVIAFFFLFNVCFNGWTGGWGIGPRYLTPVIPFLFVYAITCFDRLPIFSWSISVVSSVLMIAISSVAVMWPANSFGPPLRVDTLSAKNVVFDPQKQALYNFKEGNVSIARQGMLDYYPNPPTKPRPEDAWCSYNLGEVAGLSGRWSLLPFWMILVMHAAFIGWLYRHERKPRHPA
jgi:hypothetical protein